jgi:putative ABC transport system permease protein
VGLANDGNTNCDEIPKGSGFVGLQQSTCIWIAYMVELDEKADVAAYKDYLDGYFREQKQAGRFSWPVNNRLRESARMVEKRTCRAERYTGVVGGGTRLADCLPGEYRRFAAGKFLRRSSEIGVRRALGCAA